MSTGKDKEKTVKAVAQGNSGSREIKGTCTAGRDCSGVQEETKEQNQGQEEVGVGRRETSL